MGLRGPDATAAEEALVASSTAASPPSAVTDGRNVLAMSVLRDEHVSEVKRVACEKLLSARVEVKMRGKKVSGVMNRVHVAVPRPRDAVSRPPVIPAAVLAGKAKKKRTTEKDLELRHGGAGVYSADFRKNYDLEDPDWRYDVIPEIVDGRNVADFVDADIDARLAELEAEEEEMERTAEVEDELRRAEWEAEGELGSDDEAMLHAIETRKRSIVEGHRVKKQGNRNAPVTPRTSRGKMRSTREMHASLGDMGIDTAAAEERARREFEARDPSRGRKRARSRSAAQEENKEEPKRRVHSNRSRSVSRGGAAALEEPRPGGGLRDLEMKQRAAKRADAAQRKRNRLGFAGESDRRYKNAMPKHLFSGKTSGQKTRDWR